MGTKLSLGPFLGEVGHESGALVRHLGPTGDHSTAVGGRNPFEFGKKKHHLGTHVVKAIGNEEIPYRKTTGNPFEFVVHGGAAVIGDSSASAGGRNGEYSSKIAPSTYPDKKSGKLTPKLPLVPFRMADNTGARSTDNCSPAAGGN